MRCACGKPGSIQLVRRAMPYCEACFEALLSRLVRKEAPDSVHLRPTPGYFSDAVKALCELAKREITIDEAGNCPGCMETQAAATIRYLLGQTQELEHHFPKSITLEELQMFFKPALPVPIDNLTEDLIAFEQAYPGTIRSIAKFHEPTR